MDTRHCAVTVLAGVLSLLRPGADWRLQMVSAGAATPDHLHCSGHPAALQHCSTPWIGWAEYQTVIAKTAHIYLDAYTLYIYKVLFCILHVITNRSKYLICSKIFIDKYYNDK